MHVSHSLPCCLLVPPKTNTLHHAHPCCTWLRCFLALATGLCYSTTLLLMPFSTNSYLEFILADATATASKSLKAPLLFAVQVSSSNSCFSFFGSKSFKGVPLEVTRSILCALPGQRPFTAEVLNMHLLFLRHALANNYANITERCECVCIHHHRIPLQPT